MNRSLRKAHPILTESYRNTPVKFESDPMKTVGEDTIYMKCLPPNERTNERTTDTYRKL